MSAERDLLQKAAAQILAVRKALGPPGNYGYSTPKGEALKNLYDVHNEIERILKASDEASCPTCRGTGRVNPLIAPKGTLCLVSAMDCPACNGIGKIHE